MGTFLKEVRKLAQWLTLIIPATQEAEIPGKKVVGYDGTCLSFPTSREVKHKQENHLGKNTRLYPQNN